MHSSKLSLLTKHKEYKQQSKKIKAASAFILKEQACLCNKVSLHVNLLPPLHYLEEAMLEIHVIYL